VKLQLRLDEKIGLSAHPSDYAQSSEKHTKKRVFLMIRKVIQEDSADELAEVGKITVI
jgi:hypothetical protein